MLVRYSLLEFELFFIVFCGDFDAGLQGALFPAQRKKKMMKAKAPMMTVLKRCTIKQFCKF